jgi:hypothetical protein
VTRTRTWRARSRGARPRPRVARNFRGVPVHDARRFLVTQAAVTCARAAVARARAAVARARARARAAPRACTCCAVRDWPLGTRSTAAGTCNASNSRYRTARSWTRRSMRARATRSMRASSGVRSSGSTNELDALCVPDSNARSQAHVRRPSPASAGTYRRVVLEFMYCIPIDMHHKASKIVFYLGRMSFNV